MSPPQLLPTRDDWRARVSAMEVIGQLAQCFQKQSNGENAARAFASPMARQVHGDCVKAPLGKGARAIGRI